MVCRTNENHIKLVVMVQATLELAGLQRHRREA
jgi:hypothetical protein